MSAPPKERFRFVLHSYMPEETVAVAAAGRSRLRVQAPDGRMALELDLQEDGSLLIRGVDTHKDADGTLRSCRLVVRPEVSNVIRVSNDLY